MTKKRRDPLEDAPIGAKETIRKGNRLITFEKTKSFGKNENLDRKIISNEPAE